MVIKRTPTMITPKRDSWSAQIGEILPAENEELEELMRKEQEQDDAAAAAAEDHATGSEEVPQKSNVEKMIDRLLALKDKPAGTNSDLTEPEIISVCIQTRQIFLAQPMFLGLGVPLRICGDIHGQFTDLLKVLDKAGYPGQNNYLFLGDYVDRGRNSIEAMMLLLCYKIVYPEGLFLLRGNHESAIVNMVYGFYDECKRRYSTKVYRAFCDVFNTFPVAALVADSILCMHGGISPSLNDLDDIENIVRPCEVPNAGLLADLLWADPDPEITVSSSLATAGR
jgi:serine/threonine-protein phosphatase PP1 catalytic subunit